MTDDLLRYGTLGGAEAGEPGEIARLLEESGVGCHVDAPLELSYLGGEREKWPRALDFIRHYVELFRQWAYRHANGDSLLLREIDAYVSDLYEWLKKGKENSRLDDIELERLKAIKEALTDKLLEYVPERLISGGLASIEELLTDIENTEHVTWYPPGPSSKWYDAEIVRLGLLAEKIKLLMRLVKKIHPENADKYHYLYYLDEVVGDIASYTGVLERSRDELYASVGTGKIDLEEHLSKIDQNIRDSRSHIDKDLADLRERLSTSRGGERERMDDEASEPFGFKAGAEKIRQRKSEETIEGGEPANEGSNQTPYVEINLAARTLTVGNGMTITPSDKVWEFLKELADAKKYNMPDLKAADWKGAVDMLRNKIGKDCLRLVVEFTSQGYKLAANVKVKGGGQMGIRRSK